MATPEIGRPRSQQVLNDIRLSYEFSPTYSFIGKPPQVEILDSTFASHRRDTIFPLVAIPDWTSQNKERDSFMAEWMVMLGFKRILGESELRAELAPPVLEIGSEGRSGIDLIISKPYPEDNNNTPILGINVKLQQPRSNRKVEKYKCDNLLGCPYIELSLGDFSISTKEFGETTFITWLRQLVVPKITWSGKIPYFYKWQEYLIKKVSDTISHYMIKTDDFIHGDYMLSQQENNLFPKTEKEFRIFYENLSSAYMNFKELCEANDIKIY